ncbi:MAG: hypothetical protein HUU38_09965 [Anaerolineales bacterium]|nr:hypothetical protein [Anaerolineales bacterium]
MAEEGVYMDLDAMQTMAGAFDTMSDILTTVERVMHAAMITLRATAFVGLVGGAAVERYLSSTQPIVKQLAEKSKEINLDLISAIVYFRDGDDSGSKRFFD